MPSRRSNSATLLTAVIVGLLICAVVVVELPELRTLTDNTSNDFAVRKVSPSETTTKLSFTNCDSVQPNTKPLKFGGKVGWTSILEGVKPASAGIFILLRTLRT